ncbi:MAG: N-acetylornithine carbamoyltransferase [Candidatus Gracilibacteria bacterium]
MKTNFISGAELPLSELQKIIDSALFYKQTNSLPDYEGKILTLLFANPSLRTLLSFESGMKKMRGSVNTLQLAGSWQFEYKNGAVMNGGTQEHIKEAAQVISRYSDVIGLRNSQLITTTQTHNEAFEWDYLKKDEALTQLAHYATKPIINMESNMYHPCQSLADMMTIQDELGEVKKKKYVLTWVPHVKALPLATPHSQFLTPSIFGMDVTLVAPDGFPLDEDVIKLAEEKSSESGGSITFANNQREALKGADVVVAKSWASLDFFGDWDAENKHRNRFSDWMIDEEKMKSTNEAIFLHCLPLRRNVEVSDAVLDSSYSKIIDEAENRMWAQMSLISYLLNKSNENLTR